MKDKLLKQISDLAEIQASLEPSCRKFCADESIPVADRWEVFTNAPNKDHDVFGGPPEPEDVGLDEEISPYDDWNFERDETFDVVDRLNDWTNGDGPDYTPEIVDNFKNHYMKEYLGSWEYDW